MKKPLVLVITAMLLLCAGCVSTPPAAAPTTIATPTAAPIVTPSSTVTEPTADPTTLLKLKAPEIPSNAETIDETTGADGTYRIELLLDAVASIVIEGVPGVAPDEASITRQIKALNGSLQGEITDLEVVQDTILSERFTYPVWRITYTSGANEDTRMNVDIYIQTDAMDYRFHTGTAIDYYEDYAPAIEEWIDSLVLVD